MERLNISFNATKAERGHTGPWRGRGGLGGGVLGQLLNPPLTPHDCFPSASISVSSI